MIDETGYPKTPGLAQTAATVIRAYEAAAATQARMSLSPEAAPLLVYTLAIDHKHGTTVRVFRSEEGARDALAAWAREWWPKEAGWRDDARYTQAEFDALPDGEAIGEYFAAVGSDEWFTLDDTPLEN